MAQNLFQLAKKNSVVINEDAAKLCPELAKLDSKQLLFVILYRDYASPYHQFQDRERMMKAKRHVYGKSDVSPESEKKVQDAIAAYDSLQYDPRREQLRRIREKIISLSDKVVDTDNYKEMQNFDAAIELLNKRALSIEKELSELSQEEEVLKGGQTLSVLEKWGANMREYERANQRRGVRNESAEL